jgi:hypothetical protein
MMNDKWAGKRWDIQVAFNPWLSLGVHLDHTDPSVTLHLPGCILMAGRFGFMPGWSLRRWARTPVERIA